MACSVAAAATNVIAGPDRWHGFLFVVSSVDGGAVAIAAVVVRWTPTRRDDKMLAKAGKWAERLRNLLLFNKPDAITRDQG